MTEPIFDHNKLDVYRLSIEYAASSYGVAKTGTKRHLRDQVSVLTRRIQRTDRVTDAAIEYEYRDAEYE